MTLPVKFKKHARKKINICMLLTLLTPFTSSYAAREIEFNTNLIDANDRENLNLKSFSRAGYIMPGEYLFNVMINKNSLPEISIRYHIISDDSENSEPCITQDIISQAGLKPGVLKELRYTEADGCLITDDLSGTIMHTDLASSTLYITIPQRFMEYDDINWDPPSRWDEGINGVLFDYSLNANRFASRRMGSTRSLTGNGVAGINIGPWRVRADWQASARKKDRSTDSDWTWSQFYMYRALPQLGAKLSLGEVFLDSDLFDTLRYNGISLVSDDNMLAPNLKGYAPEITGVAKTNAKVTVSQQGRVLFETQVAPGPFRIGELSSAVNGTLLVRVEEEDGSIQEFQTETATIPYLSRPGQTRYKFASGKATSDSHDPHGPVFYTGEISRGITNGWSIYGGGTLTNGYQAFSVGTGRDLMALGAISLDATQSIAKSEGKSKTGGSYRLSYAKNFDKYDTQITFAGYRFSQRNYMTLAQFINAGGGEQFRNIVSGNSKQLYTVTTSKSFRDAGLNGYLNYSHQTYWDRDDVSRWSLSLAKTISAGRVKDINVSLSGFRSNYRKNLDRGGYLSVSIPFGNGTYVNYSAQDSNGALGQSASWSQRLDNNNNYQIGVRQEPRERNGLSGSYTHLADSARVSLNAGWQGENYQSAGLSLQGGLTVTGQGAALHRISIPGGTRLMLGTEGVSGIPVKVSGSTQYTNVFGKTVVASPGQYQRYYSRIDVNLLPDDVEVDTPATHLTMTEGAIGYREFGIIRGQKLMGLIRLIDGSVPPFGATVYRGTREVGLVTDDGYVWLTGVEPGKQMDVRWDGQIQCIIELPEHIPENILEQPSLLLPCIK